MCEGKKQETLMGAGRLEGRRHQPFIPRSERKMPVRSSSVEYLVGCRNTEFQIMLFRSSMILSYWPISNRHLCFSHETKKGKNSLKEYSGGPIPGDGCASAKIRLPGKSGTFRTFQILGRGMPSLVFYKPHIMRDACYKSISEHLKTPPITHHALLHNAMITDGPVLQVNCQLRLPTHTHP
jgi:hypothetical protein